MRTKKEIEDKIKQCKIRIKHLNDEIRTTDARMTYMVRFHQQNIDIEQSKIGVLMWILEGYNVEI